MKSRTNFSQSFANNLYSDEKGIDGACVGDENMVEISADTGFKRRFLLEDEQKTFEKYTEYLKEKLLVGQGETIIEIGVPINVEGENSSWDEPGFSEQELEDANNIHNHLLSSIDCTAFELLSRCENKKCSKIMLVRRNIDETDFIEVRIAVVGNVDAGKSTLLGVLTHNILDDGRGVARKKLFRHKHEFESGRTSSVGNDILGFNAKGEVTNKPNIHSGHLDWVDICRDSAKIVTFIDLAGHEKYLKTTIFGMTGHAPDYTMLMIGSNAGIIGTTVEHLQLALSLSVPVLVVVTKIDMCPENILAETMRNLDKLLKSPGSRKRPIIINNIQDIIHAADHFYTGRVCPIFQVSNVLGTNLELLRQFLNILPISRPDHENEPAEFQIDDTYWVDGVGTVVSGTCLAGKISLNQTMLLGPDQNGAFNPVPIKSIHRKRMPVSTVKSGQTASFALRKYTKKDVRKGMYILSSQMEPACTLEFESEILILHHPTTIAPNYQAMVHVGSVRQTATIIKMNKDVLRTGDRDIITMRFIRRPEYLRVGTRMVFREGRTKAVGTIRKTFPLADGQKMPPRKKIHPMKHSLPKVTRGITKSKSQQGAKIAAVTKL